MNSRAQGFGISGKGITATVGLMMALSVFFIAGWAMGADGTLARVLALSLNPFQPWGLVTYPFAQSGVGVVGFLFQLLWFYWIGHQLERTTGKASLVGHFFAGTLIHGLFILLASVVIGVPGEAFGATLPIAFLTMIACAMTPDAEIRLYGILPVKMKHIAIITAVITVFTLGTGSPMFGILASVPLLPAWLYGAGFFKVSPNRTNVAKAKAKKQENKEFDVYMNKVRGKEKTRQEKDEQERLRQLFERSLIDDPKD